MELVEAAALIKKLLKRPVAYHRAFCEMAGKACAGVMLSQAWYWSTRTDDDGWFYKTREEWREETGLSRSEQETARKRLVRLGFLEEQHRGMPRQLHFRLNVEKVISQLAGNQPTVSRSELRQQVGRKPASMQAGNQPTVLITEISETTQRADASVPYSQTPAGKVAGFVSARPAPERIDQRPKKIPLPASPDIAGVARLNKWGAAMGFGEDEMKAMWKAFYLKHLDEKTPPQTEAEWEVKFQRYVANCNVTKTQRQRPA